MRNPVCPVMAPNIQEVHEEIKRLYPEASKRAILTPGDTMHMIGTYCTATSVPVDSISKKDAKTVVNYIEKQRNLCGQSFLRVPYKIDYNYQGKKRTYTVLQVEGTSEYKIFNKEGKEVFPKDTKDRRKIFANLAVKQDRAVVVTHKGNKYIVNNRNQIISVKTGDMIQWGEENGDRKEILRLSQIAFIEKQKAETATPNSNVAVEGVNTEQLINHLKSIGINVFDRTQMEKYLREHPNTLLQQALEEQWEMQDIKAKAIANGTFMKAPNGKDTNLTERQWLQVRTKNFINWFGDWINDPSNASKVVDENGEPLVVYHHTNNDFPAFDTEKQTYNEFYFTTSASDKNIYYPNSARRKFHLPVFLNIRVLEYANGTAPEVPLYKSEELYKQAEEAMKEAENLYKIRNELVRKKEPVDKIREIAKKANDAAKKAELIEEEAVIEFGKVSNNPTDSRFYFPNTPTNSALGVKRDWVDGESFYIVFKPNQIKSATDNNGMFSTENDDIRMAIGNKKVPNSLDIIDESIRTGNWSGEAIDELDNLNNEDYGKILKRFSQEELKGSDEILKQAETIVFRGSRSSDASNSQGNRERAEQQIESWAKKNGLWYNDYQESKDGSLESVIETDGGVFSNKSGSESLVYWMNDGTTVKAVDASHYEGNIQRLFDKVILHNSLFPETAYSVLGFGRDIGGAFRIIVKQQIVQGTRPTTEEILSFIEKLGLEKKKGWYYTKDGKRLTDLNYGNIIKVSENTFAVIDCDIEFTPEYLNNIKDFPQLFTTPQGEIYGFVDKDGNIYLDETIIDASHPIHEYTHLWDIALEKTNPQLWKRGVNLMQEGVPGLWNEIANSENYGKLWQSNGIKGDKLVNLIASEVHARLVGENGAKLLDQIAKEKGNEGIIAKLKQWILDAWKELKATLSNWSQEEIDKLTLKDFNHMTIRDFADGINPNTIIANNSTLEQFKKDVDLLTGYYEGGGRVLSDDLPNITQELDDKLNNYFMGGEELSIDDYRELWRLIEFYDDNEERRFRERKPSLPPPSQAASNSSSLSSTAVTFGTAPTAEQQAVAQRIIAVQNAPKPETPKPERPKSVAYESALKIEDSPVTRFKRTFSPQQIKDRGAYIADLFCDYLSDAFFELINSYQNVLDDENASRASKDEAREALNKLKDPVEGRQFAAQEYGIPRIFESIRKFLTICSQHCPASKKQQFLNLIEVSYVNSEKYDALLMLFNTQASLDIEEREGIRIIDLKSAEKTAGEEENDENNTGDDEIGHVSTGSDGWSFQIRFENPANSLSKRVKNMLYNISRPDTEVDDLGVVRKYPMGQIYGSLLAYLSKNMQSPDDFLQVYKEFSEIPKEYLHDDVIDESNFKDYYPNGYPVFPVLENMKVQYPWVEQVIQKLTDDYLSPEVGDDVFPPTAGAVASQFYTNFRKSYIPYSKILLGTSKSEVIPLNYQMEDRVQFDKLQANYNNRMVLTDHSIYDTNGKVSKENAKWLAISIRHAIHLIELYKDYPEKIAKFENNPDESELTADDVRKYNRDINLIRKILQSFGISATIDGVVTYLTLNNGETLKGMLDDLDWICSVIQKVPDSQINDFNYMLDVKDNYGRNLWTHFFDNRGLITDESYMQSFYDSATKKTKYSYSADNYLMKTFRGVSMGTLEQRRKYIDEHFGKYEWFRSQRSPKGKGWRNAWLEYWYNYDGDLKEIPYRNIDNVTDRRGYVTAIRPYMKWEPKDIWMVQNMSYAPEKYHKTTSHYLAPIFSDSPMSMTVLGPRMSMEQLLTGYKDSDGDTHQGALIQLINQELWRIGLIQDRAQAIDSGTIKPIANFDGKRGNQFCFIPELNNYVFPETDKFPQQTFLARIVSLKEAIKRGEATMAAVEEHMIKAVSDIMSVKLANYNNENRPSSKEGITMEQYLNMVYANAAIIQLTTVDLAFYKDDIDFQKRFKEVYAGGIQLNTNSKYGKKTENVVIVSDDIITSPSYDKVAKVIDGSTTLSKKDKDYIKSMFTDINVADAQAIRSMHSFRSVLDMMGNWDDRKEAAMNHFKEGTWSREDFDIIYQTIKPFVYTVIERNGGSDKASRILVPQQHKNSEICALMMYDIITNSLNNSAVYKALSKFMEDNTDGNGEQLIDMIQYESAGKVGNQGTVNISFNPDKVVDVLNGDFYDTVEGNKVADIIDNDKYEFTSYWDGKKYLDNTVENAERNYQEIKNRADYYLQNDEMSQEDYNSLMSYLRPTEDEIVSMLEKAVLVTNPDGTKGINTEIVHTIPFENYCQQQPSPNLSIDAETQIGSQARNIAPADLPEDFTLTLKGKGSKTLKSADEVIDFLYELMNENLLEDFFGKNHKSGLKGIFSSKKNFADAVMDIVRGNPKYGSDFAEAFIIDKDGNFTLNPNSPTIFSTIQEIVTSLFKNRITKQKIDGAALIQAAGIGLDDSLRLQYDKDGKLKGIECYMPITSKKLFEPLLRTDEEGNKYFDIDKLPYELRKAVGYRIPTENKSSMAPLIIKGFTPLQNGSAIILPAEITTIAGSDFDVDKLYVMLSAFQVYTHDMEYARHEYAKTNALYKTYLEQFTKSELADTMLNKDEEYGFSKWFNDNKDKYELPYDEQEIKIIKYDFSKPVNENSRKARNNMVVQIMYGILTSKVGSESVLNPQGFKDVENSAKVVRIFTTPSLFDKVIAREGDENKAVKWVLTAKTSDLDKFIKDNSAPESPIYPQTFAHAHARNMAGMIQIGIYAIQGSMAAKYQRADVRLRQEQQFSINGKLMSAVDLSEGGKRLKYVGQFIGASADNGKKPNLTDMGSTSTTAPIIGYMVRLGMTPLEAAMVINQPIMINSMFKSSDWKYWKGLFGNNYPLGIPVGNVTTEMLVKGLTGAELTPEEEKDIAGLCYRVLLQHEAQEYMTQISRADSPNGAMKNSYAKSRIQQYKVDLFQAKMGQRNFPFVRIKDALSNDAVNTAASEEVIREQLKAQRMGLLHGMYALGIKSFNDLVSPYFFGANKWFDEKVVKPILYNLNEKLPDTEKENIVSNIYKSYITYILSGSPLFSNEELGSQEESEKATFKAKRDYYLYSFPDDYYKVLQKNEDIRNAIGSILSVVDFGSRKRIILQDAGSINKGQKQDIKRRLENLLYSENPEAVKLATDLLIYSYFDNGLQFTPDSFSTMFTTGFLTKFPTYTETLNNLDKSPEDSVLYRFIMQFLITYPDAAYPVDKFIGKTACDIEEDTITFNLTNKSTYNRMVNEVMSPKPLLEGINVYPYISYNGEVYVLNQDAFDSNPASAVYNKLAAYKTNSHLPLFNMNMSLQELSDEFPVDNSLLEFQPDLDYFEDSASPVAHDEYYNDNSNPDSMFETLTDNADNFAGFDTLDPFAGMNEESNNDKYTDEGNSELQKPLCS